MFGLASFIAERKTKEIGIRKVLGASIFSLILLVAKEFLKLVVLANLIAWPLAYFYMRIWLSDFAYQAGIGWEIFLISDAVSLAIALITVCYQSIKAAFTNPVESLRYE